MASNPKPSPPALGPIQFRVPQVRGGLDFYPSALEKGVRSEQALKLALAEMYVQGVSTRKVSAIVEQLCGPSVSSTQVSQCAAKLDVQLQAWRSRPLEAFPYLMLDARYEKVRHGGQLLDCAVLIAMGIDPDGKRSILGVSVALSEAEAHWRTFLQSLQQRGLHGVLLHRQRRPRRPGARPPPSFPPCLGNAASSISSKMPRPMSPAWTSGPPSPRPSAASSTAPTGQRPNPPQGSRGPLCHHRSQTRRLDGSQPAPRLCRLRPPHAHQRRLRTSNALERVNQELKRRTRVAGLFPNEASLLRLVTALLAEISDEWQTAKVYLNMENQPQPSV